ncbi:MAG: DEAD/DEAH box helicase, partial [Planctomycetales bacterium]|nr:DEAD/DEAH box helicase [Planctomycetales bacterium]
IAEAAMFEALHTGKTAYYTTPLIALTEQKFRELQSKAAHWGLHPDDVGLVTGNRRENPDARVLVVVAEILFNRLLHREAFDFTDVSAVVMDEFHSFADPERGVVWELSLGLLPPHVRTLLLSATVGNASEFVGWLRAHHRRSLDLVQSDDRKVPLTFRWVGDQMLNELIQFMADGRRYVPALIFCFNRDECWTVAEQLKGKGLLAEGQQAALVKELEEYDLSEGAGPKLKQILLRGVGVHHAGVLPKYRRVVEELFQKKLLSVCVCTETLAAGINLPARSVVLPTLVKGPPDKKRLIPPSSAHQMFGRAGRPQFDTEGFVFALPHEDDVKIFRWKEKYDQIPEDTKDPGLLKAKKALKKKMPKRRANQTYWNEEQFEKLRQAPPGKLYSRGPLPWRLLAYMLEADSNIEPIRQLISKRLMEGNQAQASQDELDRMLVALHKGRFVELEPPPPEKKPAAAPAPEEQPPSAPAPSAGFFSQALAESRAAETPKKVASDSKRPVAEDVAPPAYRPVRATPLPALFQLPLLRSVNPIYGVFLARQLGIANQAERIQALESVLDLPGTIARLVRVPPQDQLPSGPLAQNRLDPLLLQLGLATAAQLAPQPVEDDEPRGPRRFFDEERVWVLTLAEKLRLLFQHEFPGIHDLRMRPAWAAGELLEFGGNFNKYVTAKGLQKQEGMIFRHCLRLVLLLGEMRQLAPDDTTGEAWQSDLDEISDRLSAACRAVDPTSTDKMLEQAKTTGDDAL